MSEVELLVIAVAALGTAAITAVAGAGGGLVLLVVLLQFLDPIEAVPVHGVVQLVSNGTRAVSLRADADTSVLPRYLVLLVPATAVGVVLADAIPRDGGRALIGVFAILAIWWPAATAWLAPRAGGVGRFSLVGLVAGLTSPTIGANGPLIAPAFRAATKDHVSFVATFSVVQVLNHTVKVVAFAVAGVAWGAHLPVIAVASAGVMVGTRVGLRYLRRLDPVVLGRVFQAAATVGAVRLILAAV